ncbi:MAG: two-component system response regulator [Candidatus Omnitrophota bacterium]|nr:MAG: two-component system response regulator [Candidatus Omnitrophota bacterium]
MPKKILVADDEEHVLKLISARLKANSYEIITAIDGKEVIKKAVEEKPDLIILDIIMPGIDGINAFENLKKTEETASIPIIFITAFPSEELRHKIFELGAAGFVSKPFEAEDLLAKIKRALGQP